eukprot:scaffold2201_cov143-Skeletonema_menzelii.AAC.1
MEEDENERKCKCRASCHSDSENLPSHFAIITITHITSAHLHMQRTKQQHSTLAILMIWILQDYLTNMGWAGVATCFSVTAVAFLGRYTNTQEVVNASQIYAEADEYELDAMRAEQTQFERLVHETIEVLAEDIQELMYVYQLLRENQGLLILLVGGICSMMCALVSGLENVDLTCALCLSTALYGITTLLVARSARRMVIQNSHQGKPKLTKAEVRKMMNSIPKEAYVPNDDLDTCDVATIKEMISNRGQKWPNAHSSAEIKKKDAIYQLCQTTRRSHDCVICMSSFSRGETILILPLCHHEFHKACIDQWAGTFASGSCRRLDAKRGNPTCPLCNAYFVKDRLDSAKK